MPFLRKKLRAKEIYIYIYIPVRSSLLDLFAGLACLVCMLGLLAWIVCLLGLRAWITCFACLFRLASLLDLMCMHIECYVMVRMHINEYIWLKIWCVS